MKNNFVKFLVKAAIQFYNNGPSTLKHINVLSNWLIKKAWRTKTPYDTLSLHWFECLRSTQRSKRHPRKSSGLWRYNLLFSTPSLTSTYLLPHRKAVSSPLSEGRINLNFRKCYWTLYDKTKHLKFSTLSHLFKVLFIPTAGLCLP